MLGSLLCYKVPTAKLSGGVLNVTKVTIISHLITISRTDRSSCKYQTFWSKNDAGFKAVPELENQKILLLFFRLRCVHGANAALSYWHESAAGDLM